MTIEDLRERVAAVETSIDFIEGEVKELRGDVEALRREQKENSLRLDDRINRIVQNEIQHIRRGRTFWAKVLGSEGIITTIVIAFVKYVLPALLGG